MYSQIRLSGKLLAATIALALMASIAAFVFVVPFDTQAADNEAPDWEQGDGIAAGVELDVLQMYNAYDDMIVENLTDLFAGTDLARLNDFSVNKGKIRAFVSIGVTDVSNGEVTVTQRMGFEIIFKVSASVDLLNMTAPGTYNETTIDDADEVTINTVASFEIAIAFTQTFSVTFEQDTMDIVEISASVRPSAMVDLRLSKLPNYDWEGDNFTITYGSYNVFMKADVKSTLTVGFLPALKILDLPMVEGQEWDTATENLSIDLKFEGIVDLRITGTSPPVAKGNKAIDEMFENITAEMPNATGLDSFPIIIEQVSIPNEYFQETAPTVEEEEGIWDDVNFEIVDGAFPTEMIGIPVQVPLNCTGSNETDLLVVHGLADANTTVYWVWFGDDMNISIPGVMDIPLSNLTNGMHANVTDFYVGGFPYVRGLMDFAMWDDVMEDAMEGMEGQIEAAFFDMTNGTVNMSSSFTFQPMTLQAANEGIDSIGTTQDGIAASGEASSSVVDDLIALFTESPYIGVIAVVLLVVIMGMMVARRG